MPSRFNKSKLVARLVKLAIHPLVLLGALLALAIWFTYTSLQPVIQYVPVVVPGGAITIQGHGLGNQQNGSYLLIALGERQLTVRDIVLWSNDKIIARLPEGTTSGAVQVVKQLPFTPWHSSPASFVVQAGGLPSQPYGYRVPVQPEAPWPLFRHDHQNTGRSPIPATYQNDKLWSFRTGRAILSTPIIDAQGTIYIGSAGRTFALNPDSSMRWSLATGAIVDSAGALPRAGINDLETVVLPGGDGHLYALRAGDTDAERTASILWSFDAHSAPGTGYSQKFEGNVAIGYDGTLYTGNDNSNYYAFDPTGRLKWKMTTGNSNWSTAGLGDDGTLYWGSNDTYVRAVSPDGVEKWKKQTLGFVAASPAVGSDRTIYVGSFDSYFYALDPDTGQERWKFKTGEHIYSSAALGADANGNTNAIYFGSADGFLYALRPDGRLLCKYDTGDPVRSSPVIGRAPAGEKGDLVYFGSGNGKLYALNAQDCTRRWSFDTTQYDRDVFDRNDLNASPALGKTGIYIGSEQGYLWYIPYDYCLHVPNWRCQTGPGDEWPSDAADLFYVTPGGTLQTETSEPPVLPASTVITLRLVVRQNGERIRAWVCNAPVSCSKDAVRVKAEPQFPFQVQHSANGEYLHILPDDILEPGQTYTLTIEGDYYTGGVPIGNLTIGGDWRGRFQDTFTFKAEEASHLLPLAIEENRVTAIEWTRLAMPFPTMLPSLSQLGFDSLDWIMGTVALTPPDAQNRGKFILWAVGAKRDENGVLVADAQTDFALPFNGVYQNNAFVLNHQKFVIPIAGVPIPVDHIQLRGQLAQDLTVQPGASVYADTQALSIPKLGPYLAAAGLANNWIERVLAAGTFLTYPYDANGPANRHPQGVSVASVEYTPPTQSQAGQVVALLQLEPGAIYPQTAHVPGLLLVDAANTSAIYLDYRANLSSTADGYGNLATITLNIPAKTILPKNLQAIIILDVFPLDTATLTP